MGWRRQVLLNGRYEVDCVVFLCYTVVNREVNMERFCLECGNAFSTFPCWIRKGGGKYCSKECAFKSTISRRLRSLSKESELNPNWKGDSIKYHAVHRWVERRLKKPDICPRCKQKGWMDLHNISGEYKRDVKDWEWLCRRCHMIVDGRFNGRVNGKFTKKEKT